MRRALGAGEHCVMTRLLVLEPVGIKYSPEAGFLIIEIHFQDSEAAEIYGKCCQSD